MYDYKLTVGNERVKAMGMRFKQLIAAVDNIRGQSEDVRQHFEHFAFMIPTVLYSVSAYFYWSKFSHVLS